MGNHASKSGKKHLKKSTLWLIVICVFVAAVIGITAGISIKRNLSSNPPLGGRLSASERSQPRCYHRA